MSYRIHIALIEKKYVNQLHKCKTMDDLVALYSKNNWEFYQHTDTVYCPIYRLPFIYDYELGEISFDLENDVKTKIVLRKDFNEIAWDENIGRYGDDSIILKCIEEYRNKIISYLTGWRNNTYISFDGKELPFLRGDTEEETRNLHYQHLLRELDAKIYEWNNGFCEPYNLNRDSFEVARSWAYEYAIFNLVTMYKMYDEKKHYVMIFGW